MGRRSGTITINPYYTTADTDWNPPSHVREGRSRTTRSMRNHEREHQQKSPAARTHPMTTRSKSRNTESDDDNNEGMPLLNLNNDNVEGASYSNPSRDHSYSKNPENQRKSRSQTKKGKKRKRQYEKSHRSLRSSVTTTQPPCISPVGSEVPHTYTIRSNRRTRGEISPSITAISTKRPRSRTMPVLLPEVSLSRGGGVTPGGTGTTTTTSRDNRVPSTSTSALHPPGGTNSTNNIPQGLRDPLLSMVAGDAVDEALLRLLGQMGMEELGGIQNQGEDQGVVQSTTNNNNGPLNLTVQVSSTNSNHHNNGPSRSSSSLRRKADAAINNFNGTTDQSNQNYQLTSDEDEDEELLRMLDQGEGYGHSVGVAGMRQLNSERSSNTNGAGSTFQSPKETPNPNLNLPPQDNGPAPFMGTFQCPIREPLNSNPNYQNGLPMSSSAIIPSPIHHHPHLLRSLVDKEIQTETETQVEPARPKPTLEDFGTAFKAINRLVVSFKELGDPTRVLILEMEHIYSEFRRLHGLKVLKGE